MSTAPRITAGYDADAPCEIVFPAAARRAAEAAPEGPDPATLAADLAAALTTLCGMPAEAAPMAGPALPMLAAWRAADGGACSIGGGAAIAAALFNRECGGAFDAGTGAAQSQHAAQRAAMLVAALRDLLLIGAGGWEPCPPGPAVAFAVTVAGIADRIDVGLITPSETVQPRDFGDWPQRLRGVLEGLAVPVRLVLHEGKVAVRAARAFAVGDVIPIATAHEVGLRVGTLALARGQVIDSDTGSPRVRIVTRSRRVAEELP